MVRSEHLGCSANVLAFALCRSLKMQETPSSFEQNHFCEVTDLINHLLGKMCAPKFNGLHGDVGP